MHLVEQYALSCGVKINKPNIFDTYFPIGSDKYVSFHPGSKYDSKVYDHWQMVLDLISPILGRQGINIVQIGAKEEASYNNCINLQGKTSLNQAAYVIKNSIMHFGSDSFPAHFASSYNKKILAIYSNNNINNVRPYWTLEKDCVLLEPERNGGKPNYSEKESPKTINTISPEKIAKGILQLLNLEHEINIKTLFIGEKYSPSSKFIEIVPNSVVDPSQFGGADTFNIRMDLDFNQEILFKQAQVCSVNIITDKPIDLQLLKSAKNKIKGVLYLITENDNPEFAKSVIDIGMQIQLATRLNQNQMSPKKINYMDIGMVGNIIIKDLKNLINKNFVSSKCIISNRKIYPSTSYFKKDICIPDFGQHPLPYLNEEDDQMESDFFYIFES